MKLSITLLISFILLLHVPHTMQGQEETILTPNIQVEGWIATAGASEIWLFYALREDVLSFHVEATSADFDPVLTIQNENGVVIANDDYNYPANGDALLEAITIPRSGSYEVVVTGFNDSVGNYTLTMLPGYAQVALDERFTASGHWTATNIPTLMVFDGVLTVTQQEHRERGLILDGTGQQLADFYARASIQSISGNNGWIVGSGLIKTTDGGANWETVSSTITGNGVFFIDSKVVGYGG